MDTRQFEILMPRAQRPREINTFLTTISCRKPPAFSVTFGCSCSFFSSLVQNFVASSSLDRKVGLESWQFTLKWKKLQEILWAYQ
jgi:hypothetical protein